ncbi:MAG: hypothetical protein K0U98_26860 [Deltaproteobacteria bacterium]|nr:hypothetical protein [Deltaproteobacteria bacterium]
MFELLLFANAIWFGLGFHLFAIRSKIFAKTLVPKEHRETPVFDVLAESGKFLGGFNFALCAFNLLVALKSAVFPTSEQRLVLCLFFAIAHGSQFFFNVPIAIENRKGRGAWRVEGKMRFIFATDFVLMVANALAAAIYA